LLLSANLPTASPSPSPIPFPARWIGFRLDVLVALLMTAAPLLMMALRDSVSDGWLLCWIGIESVVTEETSWQYYLYLLACLSAVASKCCGLSVAQMYCLPYSPP
jgi:hypothetical protein